MIYFIQYNGKYIAERKTVKGCISLIKSKGLKDDFENCLRIVDRNGYEYNPFNGKPIKY